MPTDEQIRELRQEAASAGDSQQVRICDAALDGNDFARDDCAAVIAAARRRAEEG